MQIAYSGGYLFTSQLVFSVVGKTNIHLGVGKSYSSDSTSSHNL